MSISEFCLYGSDDKAQLLFEQLFARTLVIENDDQLKFTQLSFPIVQVAHRLVTAHCQSRDMQNSLKAIGEWVDKTNPASGKWPDEFLLAGHPESWSAYANLDGALVSLRSSLDALMPFLSLLWQSKACLPRSFADFIEEPDKWQQGNPEVYSALRKMWEQWGKELRDYRDSMVHPHYAYHQNSAPKVLIRQPPAMAICLLPDGPTKSAGSLLRFHMRRDAGAFVQDALNDLAAWLTTQLAAVNPTHPKCRVTSLSTDIPPTAKEATDIPLAQLVEFRESGSLGTPPPGNVLVRILRRDDNGKTHCADIKGRIS